MQFTITALAALLPAAILALPTSQPINERATCTTVYPSYAKVSQQSPVESYLPRFGISQEAGATDKIDMLIEFAVPAGAYGCQVETYFPAGYEINDWGRKDVYMYSVDKHLSYNPTTKLSDASWNYSPKAVSQVGTTKFESSKTAATRKVINSFACKEVMTYRLSIGGDFKETGGVTFEQNEAAGFRLKYNC